MYTIAIANQKGGVGKTTTTLNLAAALSSPSVGKKVLVLDLDYSGNGTSTFLPDFDRDKTQGSVVDIFEKKQPTFNSLSERLDFVAGSKKLAAKEREIMNSDITGFLMSVKKSLKKINHKYDYCLIDTPPSICPTLIAALVAADFVLIPLEADNYSIDGLTDLVKTILSTKEDLNDGLSIAGIFVNKADTRLSSTKQLIDDLQSKYPAVALKTYIRNAVVVRDAKNTSKMCAFWAERYAKPSKDYASLAAEIIQRIEK